MLNEGPRDASGLTWSSPRLSIVYRRLQDDDVDDDVDDVDDDVDDQMRRRGLTVETIQRLLFILLRDKIPTIGFIKYFCCTSYVGLRR